MNRYPNMKLTKSSLKKLIREEYLNGVRSFELHEATRKYVEEIRTLVRRHVTQTQGNGSLVPEKYEASEEMLVELEESMNALLEEKLDKFIMRT